MWWTPYHSNFIAIDSKTTNLTQVISWQDRRSQAALNALDIDSKYVNAKGKFTTYTGDGAIIEDEIYYIDEVKYLKESQEEDNKLKFEILTALYD